jgi:toxin CcdB
MAQFDVLRVKGNTLVLDCQSELLADLPTRFVVPLRSAKQVKPSKLTPQLSFGDQSLVMVTPLARSIATRDVAATVANVSDQEYVVKGALDMLISGF